MKPARQFDLNAQSKTTLSLYSLAACPNGQDLLIGCGLWDRERALHTTKIKNATPGLVLKINKQTGEILQQSSQLQNIVYPLHLTTNNDFLVGCRSGGLYQLDPCSMNINWLGSFGGGVYSLAWSKSLGLTLLAGRDGQLYALDDQCKLRWVLPVASDRLWNVELNRSGRIMLATSYDKNLYLVDLTTPRVMEKINLGGGSVTTVILLQHGLAACGTLGKKIYLLALNKVIAKIEMPDPVCTLIEHPQGGPLFASGYRGQIWLLDHAGIILDEFALDARDNNPVWAMKIVNDELIACWANGIIRIFPLTFYN